MGSHWKCHSVWLLLLTIFLDNSCNCIFQYIPVYCRVMFHCVNVSQFVYSVSCRHMWVVSCPRALWTKLLGMEYHKKEENLIICDTIGGPLGHYAQWSKSDRERQIPYDLTYSGIWEMRNKKPNLYTVNEQGVAVEKMGKGTDFQV